MRKCHDGKRAYSTLQDAQRAAAHLAADKAKQGNPIITFLRAYGCPCGKFHFGKTRDINWAAIK